ncbi:putative dehydrogenase [Paenibacillus eucommiae]|uniref:Dehydrogenase n=1 Tax=Paenibacillus eucommiae TaxID=1355755 RepID=A0ABS4J2D1_9BACL|nr:putative dehydrogenase [Paenibacillus eucommiae]
MHEVVELIHAICEDWQPNPNFVDGVKCQQVLEAVEQSITQRRWINVQDV